MTWLQRYRIRHYIENSMWIFPLCAMIVAIVAVRLLNWLDEVLGWQSSLDADTTRAVLGTMAASMFTFLVFVCSALLVAVQLASAQLTPRIIGLLFRDPVTKFSLTLFVFTFALSLAALVRITTFVPPLTAQVAAYSCLVSLAVFLYLIDHVGRFLRPSGALRTVASLGREVIENVYPKVPSEPPSSGSNVVFGFNEKPARTIASPRYGVVLAFDIRGLAALAQSADCVVELVPQVGDFVAVGDPLFRTFQGGASLSKDALLRSVALGQERTLEQDPTFAFRIMVDIANKGLSPAINDPTTAVLAIDQINHLLRTVGSRQLTEGQVCDTTGRLRLVYRTPDWEDFVHLAITEIRQFGGNSIQIARRLRAMLENLIQTLPETRIVLLREELNLLDRTAERFFPEPEDRALADVSDSQGVGGKHHRHQKQREMPSGELPAPALSSPPVNEEATS
jgi:uncharacterized membrane protein